jgi:hypothetical protein
MRAHVLIQRMMWRRHGQATEAALAWCAEERQRAAGRRSAIRRILDQAVELPVLKSDS